MVNPPDRTLDPLDRVVQIVGRGPDDRPFFVASGLLLVGDLAITAAHAVQDATWRYELRPVSPVHHGRPAAPLPVRRVVPHAGRDLALLVLDTERGTLPPLRFAELPYEMGQIAVHAVGFPQFTVEDSRPRSHQIDATVQLGSDRTRHQFQLAQHTSDPPAGSPGTSPWAGFSGAGILTKREGLLAGIATSHRPAGGRRSTTGTDLSALTDPAFLALLAEHGVEPAPIPVRPPTVRAPGSAHWLPDDVRAVLSRQRNAADELPHRFRQDRRPRRLTAVYVRQLLSRQQEERAAGEPTDAVGADARQVSGLAPPHGMEGASGPPSPVGARRPAPTLGSGPAKHAAAVGPPRRLEQVLAHDGSGRENGTGHTLVEAGPGAGKSTLLHSCALDFGDAALASATGHGRLVPLWVTATQLIGPGYSLESAVAAATGLDTGNGTLPRLPHDARWLVLVDALDEVHHDRRSRLLHLLADQAAGEQPDGLRMLVTTRHDPEGREELSRAGFQPYVLDPFDRQRLEEFAHAWFRDARRDSEGPGPAEEFLRQIDDIGIGDLLRNPLLATVTAVVFENAADRPLPDNRWALYEEYRAHLRATKREQAGELWHDLAERASGTRHGPHAVTQLRERIEELLGHLAYAQIADGARDLPQVARCWWEETATDADGRLFGAVPPVDGWPDAITDALLGTGLLVRRGRDLEFLHTTFTEHLAAQRLADRLPDAFDPGAHEWRTTIVAASGRGAHPLAELHRTALVHYGHRHRGGGQALLEWLQQGPDDDQLLAGELLAEGCPSQDVHYQRFLATMEIPRGVDTEATAWDLLGLMRNAGVTAYLRDSAQGTGPRKVWAAMALMTHDAASAALALRRMATDPAVNPELLADAAKYLVEYHPEHTADAAAALHGVLGHPRAGAWDRTDAAAFLATLGDEHVAQAAEALIALVDGAGSGDSAVGRAIEQLAGLGGEYERESARRMVRLAAAPTTSPFQRMEWVRRLCELGEAHAPAAAQVIQAILDDPQSDWHDRVACADLLTGLGWGYVEQAGSAWRTLGDDPDAPAGQKVAALEKGLRRLRELSDAAAARRVPELAGVPLGDARRPAEQAEQGEPSIEMVDQAMGTLLAESRGVIAQQAAAARLREWGEPQLGAAERSLRELVAAPGTSTAHRLTATCGLLLLDRLRPPTDTSLFGTLLTDPSVHAGLREQAVEALRAAGEGYLDQFVGDLARVLCDRGGSAADRHAAADSLAHFGSAHLAKAASVLSADMTRPDASARTRRDAARGLLLLGGPHVPVDTDVLRAVVADRGTSPGERLRAVDILVGLDRDYAEEAARVLHAVATQRRVEDDDFERAVELLLRLGERHRPQAVRTLCTALRRWHHGHLAAEIMADLGEPCTGLAAKAIRGAAGRRGVSSGDRQEMAEALVEFGEKYKPDAARILHGIIRRPRAEYFERAMAAKELAELGEPYVDMAAKALARAPLGLLDRADNRQELAEFLISLGRAHWPEAAKVLLGIIDERTADSNDLDRAVTTLSHLGEEFREPTLRALRRAASGRRSPVPFAYDRDDAAEALAALESRAPGDPGSPGTGLSGPPPAQPPPAAP
ncbi:trypsin-like peptidase domain-containing protein [Streptomyces sp. NBC_01092]|uniref:trypsin-like peptidase domain-containing protein n=1 Tax=Streptomyces sp. NBC_01092 TaxID=2903748 RepID=UPI00386C3F2D|nr:trypsin-like peptidase domain-containing protein [Streptomyces sp. NBC_01092]